MPLRAWCAGCAAGAHAPSCARCGRRPSTTSPPPSAPGCRCPRRCRQLGDRGPEALRAAVRARSPTTTASTGRFGDCLDRLKDELADPVGDRIVEALRIAREVGGSDLGRLLRTLSAFLREDARTRAELETRQGWTVNAARLAVAAPWLVLLLLSTQPTRWPPTTRPPGTAVLLGRRRGLRWSPTGSMLRIGRLPEDERVLR